ncbi:MAG: TonB-dependent receptor [Breznakibacter sp.]
MSLSLIRIGVLLIFLNQFFGLRAGDHPSVAKKKVTLSGHIKDASTGEVLVGATVFVRELSLGNVANGYGFYSLSLPEGNYTVEYGFLGYASQVVVLSLTGDVVNNVDLLAKSESLNEVVVQSRRKDENIRNPEMGVQKLQARTIKNVPVLMGETDLIKVIQLMPGVQATSEGSTGFSVRGGNPDQNLILLDEATVYNAGHLMGFFSVFNNDAVKDVKLYKGDIPAAYGGRLSSLLDVRMKDGNSSRFSGSGGIGTISSRLTLEGPIVNEKTTFIVSGRRTYADIFLALSSDEAIRDNTLFFYDLNAKLSHTFNANNRVFVSGYFGRDVFRAEDQEMSFGNQTYTLRWNHIFSPKLFCNVTLLNSYYDYFLKAEESSANSVEWESKLHDFGGKVDFIWYLDPAHTLDFGGQSIYHKIKPGLAQGKGSESLFSRIEMPVSNTLEHALYLSHDYKVASWFSIKYGVRFSAFQNMGATTQYYFDAAHQLSEAIEYGGGDVYHTYYRIEPRLSSSFILNPSTSVKAGYSRTTQYLHQATTSSSGSPLDVWFASSPNVKPQVSDQVSVGLFKNFLDNLIEASVELFYKDMKHSIDFKDHADVLLNEYLEGELRFGKTKAYGAELMLKLNLDKWNGWVSYTRSRAERFFDEINEGLSYLSPYDHPHDCSIVLNHQLTARTMISANWVFYTGNPTTYPVARYEVGGDIIPYYPRRNANRMPDYHRLDLSLTLASKKRESRRWSGEWVFSVYNAYGRKNAWTINYERDQDDPYLVRAEKTYLFSFIPSITYNFNF